MEINLGDEQIVELQSPFTPAEIQEKALSKRVDAFGQIDEDTTVVTVVDSTPPAVTSITADPEVLSPVSHNSCP